MTQEPIINALQQIKTGDLRVIGAKIREGSELQKGQIATFEVSFLLLREIEYFSARLRIYKTDGRCIFISDFKSQFYLVNGYYLANFFIIAELPAENYVASFEFQENTLIQPDVFECKKILELNNAYVNFVVKINNNLYNENMDCIEIPMELTINSLGQGGVALENFSKITSVNSFPWSLTEDNLIIIETLINKVYKKIIGEDPSRFDLENLLKIYNDNYGDINAVLDFILKDHRSWSRSIRNNAGKLVDSVYLALLNRKPEFDTIDLKKNIELTSYLRGIVNSPEFLALHTPRLAFEKFKNFGRDFKIDNNPKIDGDCVLVHTPLDGIFVYCALACCRQIRIDYPEKKIYLLSDVNLQSEIYDLAMDSLPIDGIFLTRDVIDNKTVIDLIPGLILYYSEIDMNNAISLIKLYPQAILGVMSDGFRNAVNIIRWMPYAKVEIIYFFGFKGVLKSKESSVEKVIPLSFVWEMQKFFLDKRWGHSFDLDIKNYSVFYPRYWWRHPYEFSRELIVSSWIDAVLQNSSEDEVIVIKSSPLYGDDIGVISDFREKLAERGRIVTYAGEFCESLGLEKEMANLPSEDLIYLGVFDKAKKHYVLDGSLATIITSHPCMVKPFQVVLGSKIERIFAVASSALISNLSTQMDGLMALSNFLLINNADVAAGEFPAVIEIV